jgi:hypothetical protein
MTCVDELAHEARHDSAPPRCPAADGPAHGERVVPPSGASSPIAPAIVLATVRPAYDESAPPSAPRRSLERPPRV